ncbi:non-ribosomal peptide synthetase, partial [Skermania pinensis]
ADPAAAAPAGLAQQLPADPDRPAPPAGSDRPADLEVVDTFGGKWDPDGPITPEDRLAEIVAESMGYAVEDIPREIPLIELGLDSLMAMRIKNRVEYEFDIPQLQLQAVRDANLIDVGKYLRYAIEHRDEVQALAEQQAAEKVAAEEAAAADAEAVAERLDNEDTSVIAEAEQITEQSAAAAEPVAAAEPAAAEAQPEPEPAPIGDGNVPPRDPAERLTFATWAVVTGESAKGVRNTLPILTEEVAEKLAARLSERAKGEITVDDVLDAETIEQLADQVRNLMESSDLDGFVRTLRAPEAGSAAVPVFVFHPSGSTTTVYEPLLRRLPAATPMYGFERVDGEIEARARQYLPALRKLQGDGPYVLYGWSLGGVLALTVAKLLRAEGADVQLVGMIDLALPTERPAQGPAANRERFERYAAFAARTYGIDQDAIPVDQLAEASEAEQVKIITDLVKMSGANVPVSMIEHERQSWIDSRALANVSASEYDGAAVLYLADRYHDGMIELEPVYRNRAPNGGWDGYIADLEIIHVGGDHVQIVDEPYVAKIGADLTRRLAQIVPEGRG